MRFLELSVTIRSQTAPTFCARPYECAGRSVDRFGLLYGLCLKNPHRQNMAGSSSGEDPAVMLLL